MLALGGCHIDGSCPEDCATRGDIGLSGGDPHFVVQLPQTGNLCFDVHGTPGQFINLLSTANLLVNSLVVKAPSSVEGTYHGAIGIVAAAPNQIDQDQVVVLADGTVQFNGRTMMARSTMNSTAMFKGNSIVVVVSPAVVNVYTPDNQIAFTLRFVNDQRDRIHLDFSIDKFPSDPNGATHGILGEFRLCDAHLSLLQRT